MLVYKFVGESRWALSALELRRLKIATVGELNDPFELKAYRPRDQSERRVYDGHRKTASQRAGIISFCKSWNNPVVWGHYADNHRGICLGFEVQSEALHTVRYHHERLTDAPDYEKMSNFKYPVEMFTSKFSHWSYEEEVRLVVRLREPDPVTGLHFLPFDRNVRLKEVIFGALCTTPLDFVERLLVDLPHVKIMKARLAFQDFSVTRQRHRRMQQKRQSTNKIV